MQILRAVLFILALTLLVSLSVSSAQSWYQVWNYRKAITINASQVAADLAGFPLLVDITDADLSSFAQADGDDIIFTADDGSSLLDYEIESYRSTTGHLVAWVRIPTLSSTANTVIYLYYGNPCVNGSLGNPNGVWDAHYVMVQHLDEVSGTHFDSTSNANNGTTVVVSNQDAAGIINGADEFDGSTSYIRVPDAASLQFGAGSFTAEAWIYPHAAAGADGVRIVNNRGTGTGGAVKGWQLKIANSGSSWVVGRSAIDDGSDNFKRYDGTTTYAYNQWYQVVMVYEADQELRFYVDGSLDGTLAVGSYGDISNALPTVIGASLADLGVEGSVPAQVFDGRIDEVRISDAVRSSAWIQTSYNNQHAPGSFSALGVVETMGAEPCEGNFNCDEDVDGSDAIIFKQDFGRSIYKRPCTNVDPCSGDFDCDGDVDGSNARIFKLDFGRSGVKNPCPARAPEGCVYP